MIKGMLALLPIVHILNSQVIAQRLARRLAQSQTSRRLRELDVYANWTNDNTCKTTK